jgi:hypothetical protein
VINEADRIEEEFKIVEKKIVKVQLKELRKLQQTHQVNVLNALSMCTENS